MSDINATRLPFSNKYVSIPLWNLNEGVIDLVNHTLTRGER